ncbi:MAG: cytidylate kinase-like family protein [Oscillospiraceae bacterium]
MNNNIVVTIARQYGSGGRKVARKVAEILGIGYYDKDLIAIAAKESGLSENLFEGIDEKPTNSLLYSLVMGIQSGRNMYYNYGDMLNADGIFRIQSQVIQGLVEKEPCVIVGRCSDYVLREHEKLVNVFIHADEDYRVNRIMELEKLKEKEALDIIHKTDKRRSGYYNFYTNNVWGNADNYHISLDSGSIGIDETAKLIAEYVKIKCK